jgi:arabinogalactan endo-1,4-beta-galactosidase
LTGPPLALSAILLAAACLTASALQVTYRVNLQTQIASGKFRPGTDTVFVSGTFSTPNWIVTAAAGAYTLRPSADDSNVYTGTFNIHNSPASTEQHRFVINPNNSFSNLNSETLAGGDNRSFQVGSGSMTLPVVSFNGQSLPAAIPFLAGADFSLLPFFEGRGILYKDGGQAQDGLAILKNHNLTCVRLRLFTSSAAQAQTDPYDYTNNLAYTVPLAVRVKNAGLQFLLDFHYSDSWADPAHQTKPAAWTNLAFAQLVQQMHDYNSNCISAFKAAGAMPDYVQVGNEITGGMLWPDGKVGTTNDAVQWPQLAQLMNAAIQGITDASGANPPKIVIHIDRGGDWSSTRWFFDNLIEQGVPFDIIGESYYPFWHGPLANLANCLTNAAQRYGKPVIVAETAFPWTNSYWTTNILGLTPSVTGQVQFVVGLAQALKSVPGRLGAGVFYWGTEYQKVRNVNEAGFNTASFFDAGGNLLPVADAIAQIVAPLRLNANLDGTSLKLTWPLSGAGSSLVTTTGMAPGAVWLPVTNSVRNTGMLFNVALPLDAADSRFYRLQSH